MAVAKDEKDAKDSAQSGSRPLGGIPDAAAYWLITGGIYISLGFLWYYSAKEKLFDQDGTMPDPLKDQFNGTFIDSVPGLDASWTMLGLLEAVAFLVILGSLVGGEFLPTRRKPILLAGLGLSMFTFAVMGFAENMTAQFDSVASLFGYFTGTAVVFFLVLLLPPYRPTHWLVGLFER